MAVLDRFLAGIALPKAGGPNGLPPPLARASVRNSEGGLSHQPPGQSATGLSGSCAEKTGVPTQITMGGELRSR
jgi:hypothetical protein